MSLDALAGREPGFDDVSDFPQFEYSMKDVLRAGEMLAGKMIWTPESRPKIIEAFRIANNWRDSHAYPMRKVRSELSSAMRQCAVRGHTVARLKRMPSIRRKLQKLPGKLNQMQDLAGCRAILPLMKDVTSLTDLLRSGSTHVLHNEADYINKPKPDGYRCHHMVFKFWGAGDDQAFTGRRIEIQVRTRLQHSWATAVEAVGLWRLEDLKSGLGSPDWLRLFVLMSEEFALAERCIEPSDLHSRQARIAEIIHLNAALKATNLLENLSQGVRYTEQYKGQETAKYWLIKYDTTNNAVSVEPQISARVGAESYDNAEYTDRSSGSMNTVLVEADKIETIKYAYPNYFGDVQLFMDRLIYITKGEGASKFILKPQEIIPAKKKRERADLSWLRRFKRWT
jgi:Region found in RelA / SpoT proteins